MWTGCLMLIAWMMCASTALLLSKYYKRMWPNDTLCGVEVWFAVSLLPCPLLVLIFGPIPWGHSGPLCHALSLLLLSSSWTSMRSRRATVAALAIPGEWQCKTACSSKWAQHFPNVSCFIYWPIFFLHLA